jgi:hypothetical protein
MITLSSLTLLTAKPATAQSIPKPSVPEFTTELISPPEESQSVNRTIQLSIKNQPSLSDYGFFYMVRARINDGKWSLLYTIDNVPVQSNEEYTTFSYPSDGPVVEYQYYLGDRIENLFAGDKVDFQVQAMIGNIHRVYNPNHTSQLDMYPYVFTGEVSDWSNTQTITIPYGSVSSSTPNPTTPTTPTPSDYIPQTTLLLVGIATVVVILLLLTFIRRHQKPSA